MKDSPRGPLQRIVSLRCWSCGATADAASNSDIQYAFQLADLADSIGWVGVIDIRAGRSLVFCSQKCLDDQTTNAGNIRKRPKRTNAS